MSGSGFQTKPGFEVKGSSREEDSGCSCRLKGINWGAAQPQREDSANFLNDVLLETQQDQKNMQMIFSGGGEAGYLETGQRETALSDLAQA